MARNKNKNGSTGPGASTGHNSSGNGNGNGDARRHGATGKDNGNGNGSGPGTGNGGHPDGNAEGKANGAGQGNGGGQGNGAGQGHGAGDAGNGAANVNGIVNSAGNGNVNGAGNGNVNGSATANGNGSQTTVLTAPRLEGHTRLRRWIANRDALRTLFSMPADPAEEAVRSEVRVLKREAQESLERARHLERLARQKNQALSGVRRRGLADERRRHILEMVHADSDLDPDRPVTPIPPVTEPGVRQIEETAHIDDLVHTRVLYDGNTRRYRYEVIEPPLDRTEREVLRFVRDTLHRTLPGRQQAGSETDWEEHLEKTLDRLIVDRFILIDDVSRQRVRYHLLRDLLGYGIVDVLMRDPMVEDVSCDGPGIPLYVFHRQYGSVCTNLVFPHDDELDSFVVRLAQMCGKHISLAEPLLDATLPDSSRLQATLSREVTTRGSTFTIRRFRADPLTTPDLIRLGTIDASLAAYYWLAMEHGHSLLFAGGTASGKTTTLNAACQFIPPDRKIVSIEDTREINLQHENWIAGVARPGFSDSRGAGRDGAIDMYRLLEAALRQRPEYLLVGEVRGVEAKTLFQAMATGHATYSTLHADSAMSAVYRLENPPISVPRIMLQTLDAVAIQVQVRIGDRMLRRTKEVTEIVSIHPDSGDLVTNTVFRWDVGTDSFEYTGSSHVLSAIMEKCNLGRAELEAEWQRRAHLLQWMAESGLRRIQDVSETVAAYYADPDEVLDRIAQDLGTPVMNVLRR